MPRVKSTKSLKEISFHFILKNPEFYCQTFTIEEMEDGENALDSDLVNPINQLRK